jgi:Trm5-related predicted tRNA methylase
MEWQYPKDIVDEKIKNNRHKVMDQIKYNTIKLKDIRNIKEKLAYENKIRRQKFMVLQQIKLSHMKLKTPPNFIIDCSETEDEGDETEDDCDCFSQLS